MHYLQKLFTINLLLIIIIGESAFSSVPTTKNEWNANRSAIDEIA